MPYTDDPIADFHAYDREQQAKLDKLPVCSDCDCSIQGKYYYINGECICEDCIEDYERNTEDFMD
jgi:hypothetical protein